jgi:hypothetical protein
VRRFDIIFEYTESYPNEALCIRLCGFYASPIDFLHRPDAYHTAAPGVALIKTESYPAADTEQTLGFRTSDVPGTTAPSFYHLPGADILSPRLRYFRRRSLQWKKSLFLAATAKPAFTQKSVSRWILRLNCFAALKIFIGIQIALLRRGQTDTNRFIRHKRRALGTFGSE